MAGALPSLSKRATSPSSLSVTNTVPRGQGDTIGLMVAIHLLPKFQCAFHFVEDEYRGRSAIRDQNAPIATPVAAGRVPGRHFA